MAVQSTIIQLRNMTKRFGSFRALDRVSVDFPTGITGLLGPNGAGKSTLIKVVLGLLRATDGTGQVLDYEIGRDARELRTRVGYMPEDDCYLYGMTGVESVHLSARLSGLPSKEGLRRSHEIIDYCGLAQERYRRVETYSTGMRQKLRFAQAIVHDPQLLILDEPTSGLDPEERDIMLRRIQRLARDHGKSVLLCTHILPDVQSVSDAVVILAAGRVRVADRLSELGRPAEPTLRVRVLGEPEGLLRSLGGRGVSAECTSDGSILVRGPTADLASCVWSAARDSKVALRSLSPSLNSLEEIFLAAVQEQPDGGS